MTAALAVGPAAREAAHGWRAHLLALFAAAAAILALFARDAAHMAGVWWESATFNHCLLIPFLLAWLVRQRLPELRRLAPRAWAPGLAVVALGACSWLVGEAAAAALARHLGLVLMLQGAVIACLGPAVARGLAFPLFYAFFLVPAGEELVPAMQTLTAAMAMALLDLSGVPAHIEGVFITIPSGYFEIAEACAGLKFLVAMAAFGALAANVCFRSARRRILFLAAALVVPVLANGVRAWGTIYIAHRTSVEFAVGLDHVVYGGVFFAVVMALLLAAAWPFFDRRPGDAWFDPRDLQAEGAEPGSPRRAGRIAAAAASVAAAPLLWSAAVAQAGERPIAADFRLPEVAGWERAGVPDDWRPHHPGADLFRIARYRDAAGREVDLAIAVYARQEEGRELVGEGRGAAGPESRWAWSADLPAPPGGRAERLASHGLARDVASFYRVGDVVTGSGARVKLETMKTRLLGGPQHAAAVLVSAEGQGAGDAIGDFLAALGPIERLADRAAGAE